MTPVSLCSVRIKIGTQVLPAPYFGFLSDDGFPAITVYYRTVQRRSSRSSSYSLIRGCQPAVDSHQLFAVPDLYQSTSQITSGIEFINYRSGLAESGTSTVILDAVTTVVTSSSLASRPFLFSLSLPYNFRPLFSIFSFNSPLLTPRAFISDSTSPSHLSLGLLTPRLPTVVATDFNSLCLPPC
jgi:hypothetical protein